MLKVEDAIEAWQKFEARASAKRSTQIDRIKEDKKAFYRLDEKGELQPLDYDSEIAENHILWD